MECRADDHLSADPLNDSSPSSCFLPVARSLAQHLEQIKHNGSSPTLSEPSDDLSERRYSDFSQASVTILESKRRPSLQQSIPPQTLFPSQRRNSSSTPLRAAQSHSHSHTVHNQPLSLSSISSPPAPAPQQTAQRKSKSTLHKQVKQINIPPTSTASATTGTDSNSFSSLRRLFHSKNNSNSSTSKSLKHSKKLSKDQSRLQFYGVPADTEPTFYHSPYFVMPDEPPSRPQPIRPVLLEQDRNTKNRGINAVWKFLSGQSRSKPKPNRLSRRGNHSTSPSIDNLKNNNIYNNNIPDKNHINNHFNCKNSFDNVNDKVNNNITYPSTTTQQNTRRADWVAESFRLLRRSSNLSGTDNIEKTIRTSSSKSNAACTGSSITLTNPSPLSIPTTPSPRPSSFSRTYMNSKHHYSQNSYRTRSSNTSSSSATVDAYMQPGSNVPKSPTDRMSSRAAEYGAMHKQNNSHGALPIFHNVSRAATYADAREPNTFGGFRSRLVFTTDSSSVSSCSDRDDDAQHLLLSHRQMLALKIK